MQHVGDGKAQYTFPFQLMLFKRFSVLLDRSRFSTDSENKPIKRFDIVEGAISTAD